MSYLYIVIVCCAAWMLADDMGLGNVHPVKGAFIMLALVYNVAYTIYWKKRKCK